MKKLISATILGLLVAGSIATTSLADEQVILSPAAMEQLTLANKLIALGDARKDPLLLIVGAKLQKTLNDEAIATQAGIVGNTEVLQRAKALAKGQDDLIGIAEDVEAMGSKGCSVRYGCQNPYIKIQ